MLEHHLATCTKNRSLVSFPLVSIFLQYIHFDAGSWQTGLVFDASGFFPAHKAFLEYISSHSIEG
jgi:hypothetical protein